MKPVKIILISYNFAPEPIGIPYYNTAMLQWLSKQADTVVAVHTGIPHYPWWKVPEEYRRKDYRWGRADEIIDGIPVHRVWHYVPVHPITALKRIRLDLSYLWHTFVRSFRFRTKPDIIILVAPPFLSGLLGLFLRWRWRCRLIYHVQDLQVDASVELNLLPPIFVRILTCFEKLILEQVDLVSTISERMRERLQAKAETRRPIALFPNWTNIDVTRPHLGPNRYRLEWGIEDETIVVAYSGSIGKKQGIETLVEAAVLLQSSTSLKFVISGDGAGRPLLEAEIIRLGIKNLILLPLVPAEQLSEFLCAADIHCILQRKAAADLVMPSKLLNILAVAKPVVVTAEKLTELAITVTSANCGLVVEPEQPVKLVEAILFLAADATLRNLMGAAGRNYVKQHFGQEAVLGRFSTRIKTLHQSSRRRAILRNN